MTLSEGGPAEVGRHGARHPSACHIGGLQGPSVLCLCRAGSLLCPGWEGSPVPRLGSSSGTWELMQLMGSAPSGFCSPREGAKLPRGDAPPKAAAYRGLSRERGFPGPRSMNEGCSCALRHRDHCRARGLDRKLSEPHVLGPRHFSRSWPTLLTRQQEVGEASGRMEENHKT